MDENKREKIRFSFEAIVSINENCAIASAMEFNGLFKVDLENGECTFLQFFLEEKRDQQRLFAKALKYQNKVIFIPGAAEKLAVYDWTKNAIYYKVVLSKDDTTPALFNRFYKFTEALIKGNILYLIPSTYRAIVLVNLESWVVSEIQIDTSEKFMFRKGMCEVDSSVFIPSVINNLVLEFNYCTLKVTIHHVGESNQGCWSICNCNGLFYLAPKSKGGILRWNKESGIVEELNDYPLHFKGNDFLFSKIYAREDSLYVIPVYANIFLKINTNNCRMQELDVIDMNDVKSIAFLSEEEGYYLLRKENKKGLFEFLVLNTSNNKVQTIDFYISSDSNLWDEIISQERFLKETMSLGLGHFIKGLAHLSDKGTEEIYETKKMFSEQIKKIIMP